MRRVHQKLRISFKISWVNFFSRHPVFSSEFGHHLCLNMWPLRSVHLCLMAGPTYRRTGKRKIKLDPGAKVMQSWCGSKPFRYLLQSPSGIISGSLQVRSWQRHWNQLFIHHLPHLRMVIARLLTITRVFGLSMNFHLHAVLGPDSINQGSNQDINPSLPFSHQSFSIFFG